MDKNVIEKKTVKPNKDTPVSQIKTTEQSDVQSVSIVQSSQSPIGSDSEEDTSPLDCKGINQSPLANLMTRTGYSIVQQNGQRRYGPPPSWKGLPPKRGCEVFVGKIPRDCFEDELVPVFERAGRIYEVRLMMDYNGQNRGYAFVVFANAADAKDSVKLINNFEIRQGRTLGVCMSVDNCRLFIGGIPKRVNKDDIREEMEKVTEGVVDVIVYPSASDKTKNRGFAFVEYESHRAAAMARRKFMNGRVQLWNHQIAIDWAEPELEVDEEIMAHVKVLYVRNLMLTTTEQLINDTFACYSPIERVKKIRDYAFVHFQTREGAIKAMKALNGSIFDGAKIEVTLAKPVDKDSKTSPNRIPRQISSTTIPTFGFLPIEYSLLPTLYPAAGYIPSPGKYLPRNSMGAKVIPSPRSIKNKPHPLYPMTFNPPHITTVYPTANQGQYGGSCNTTTNNNNIAQYIDTPKRHTEDAYFDVHTNSEVSPMQSAGQAPPSLHTPPTTMNLKPMKSPLQILEDVCTTNNNWGTPIYSLYTISPSPEGQLYQYKVFIPALGTTYIPSQYSRTIEEAQCTAAEYSLIQLGYPLEATGYSSSRGLPCASPLSAEATPIQSHHYSPHSFVTLQNSPKHVTHSIQPNWSPEIAASLYAGFDAAFHSHSQFPTPELYHRGF